MLDEIIDYVKFLQLQVKVCVPPQPLVFTAMFVSIDKLFSASVLMPLLSFEGP